MALGEQYANDASSTLSGTISSGDTSLDVADASSFPTSAPFRLIIDAEIILVGARSGATFSSLSRGEEGTDAAGHTDGATVSHKLTAAGLAASRRRGVVRIVAASDAHADTKASADLVCDGTADEVEIQAAIDALPATGGAVLLTEGTFNVAATITIPTHGVKLRGIGVGHSTGATHNSDGTKLQAVTGLTGAVVLVQLTADTAPLQGIQIADLVIDGGDIGTGVHGIHAKAYRSIIERVYVYQCSGDGIRVEGYSGWATYDTIISHCQSGDNAGTGINLHTYAQDVHVLECIVHDNLASGIRIAAGSGQITQCHLYSNAPYNVFFAGSGSRTKIVGCKIEQAAQHGLFFDSSAVGASDIQILGCNFKNSGALTDNTYDHLNVTGSSSYAVTRMNIGHCSFTWTSGNKPRYGINLSGSTVQGALVVGNTFGSAAQFGTAPVNDASSTSAYALIRHNLGWLTETSGFATVASGNTYIDVTHNIARPSGPNLEDIHVTPTNNLGSAAKFWISDVGATTFRINVDADPGATTATFAWQALSLWR